MEYLPEDILMKIFTKLPSEDLRESVPLVCKSWTDIWTERTSLWHTQIVDLPNGAQPLRGPAQQFFRTRREHVTALHLNLPSTQASLASDILEALGNEPPLKRFSIDFRGALAADVPTFLPQVFWLRQLRAVKIEGLKGPLRAAQFKGLRFLRHLRLLDLSFPSETGGTELDGFPDGLLSCTKLEALHMGFAGMFSFRILPEGFGRLKELKELVIIGCGALGFRRDFTELTKLSHLVMIDPGPARSLKFPKNLSAMQSLTDVHIQCKDIPVELGTLPNLQTLTLRRLDPGPRRNMKQIERDFVRFFARLSLTRLELLDCGVFEIPEELLSHISLRSLSVKECMLDYLHEGPYLEKLTSLELWGNPFQMTPLEVLPLAPALERYSHVEGEWVNMVELRELVGKVPAQKSQIQGQEHGQIGLSESSDRV